MFHRRLSIEKDKASGLFHQKTRQTHVFGFKDPRTTILLPFWQDVFKHLKLNDTYIPALRNPIGVAESLYRRDGIVKRYHF